MSKIARLRGERRSIADCSSAERRAIFCNFVDDVVLPQRERLLKFREATFQTAQVDSDGYLAQIVTSIVLGVPGNRRRGKTGMHKGDLVDGTEVKSSYRTEQKGGKEDAHINFGAMTEARMAKFMDRDRCSIVVTSFDRLGRFKIEVLVLSLPDVVQRVSDFYASSVMAKPQLQTRLYRDHRRDELMGTTTGLMALGARLVARAVATGDGAVVDKWAPEGPGLEIQEVLDLAAPRTPYVPRQRDLVDLAINADSFFDNCLANYRHVLRPYCDLTDSTQNLGFGNLAQHLVSLVTGIPGTDSNARGADLDGGGEIKLATGCRGDDLGTEDRPRLNLQKNKNKILSWPALYAVRIMCEANALKAKVLQAPIDEFRRQVEDYFAPGSAYENSDNMQYHVRCDFHENSFYGKRGDGGQRVLGCEELWRRVEPQSRIA